MKHFISILSVCLISLVSIYAQNRGTSKSSIVFSSGVAQPIGKLAESNYKDSSSGFAKPGAVFNLQYQHEIDGGWGFYINTQLACLGFDNEKYRKVHADRYNWELSSNKSKNYAIGSFTMGLSYEIYHKKHFSLSPYAGVGISYCRNRTMDYTQSSAGMSLRIQQTSDLVNCRNFQYGIRAYYHLSKSSSLVFGIGLQHQSPAYQITKTTTVQAEGSNSVSNTNVSNYRLQQNFSTVSLGLRYSLGN